MPKLCNIAACSNMVSDRGQLCEPCDRKMRDEVRVTSGIEPLTDVAYTELRYILFGGRSARSVLVVNGCRL